MSSANNTTIEIFTEGNTDRQPSAAIVILLGILIVTGTLANGYIIVVLLKKSRRSPLNMTIVNLAIVDSLILLLVIPMCLVTLALPGVTTPLCSITGILGPLLSTYSLQIQCLILCTTARNVTKVSPNNKAAVSLIHLALISVTCLTVDICVVVFSSIKYGYLQKVPSIGYCFVTYDNVFRMLMTAFYGVHLSGSVLLCTIIYIVITRFVRKNSARQSLARQRHVEIFKMTFCKLLIWVLSYTFITVTRLVGYKNMWPEVTFQLSYFLLWSNCVMNPLSHILRSPLGRTIVSWFSTRVATVAPEHNTQMTNQRNSGSSSSHTDRPEQHGPKPQNNRNDLDKMFTIQTQQNLQLRLKKFTP